MSHLEMPPCIKEGLKDIFGHYVVVSKIEGGIELDCGSSTTIAFDTLKRISEIFRTERIDVNNTFIQGGYCETCSYEDTQVTIQILKPDGL